MVYLALFRGINVGGKNIIKMDVLKTIFEGLGFTGVKTYIQSGNVLFTSAKTDKISLAKKIKSGFREALNLELEIMIFTDQEIRQIVEQAPPGFGENDQFKYNVLYFMHPHKPSDSIKEIKVRDQVDTIHEGKFVIYASYAKSHAGRSYLPKIIELPVYKYITIRNWNTTKKLYSMIEDW